MNIRISYNLIRTNIFDIRIRSCCEQQIYSIFVFEYEYIWYLYSVKSFINMFLFIDRQQKSLGTCIDLHQTLLKIYFIQFLHFIYSIFAFSQVSKNEYIWYPYSVRCLKTNILDIRRQSGCYTFDICILLAV